MANSMTAAKKSKMTLDLTGKSADQLQTQLLDLRREQMNLRFQRATGQAQGTARVTSVRKDIARVMTQLSVLKKKDTK